MTATNSFLPAIFLRAHTETEAGEKSSRHQILVPIHVVLCDINTKVMGAESVLIGSGKFGFLLSRITETYVSVINDLLHLAL